MKNSLKNNKNNNNENITIDAKHNEMINHFNKLNDSLPKLKEKLNKLITDFKNSKDKSRKNDIEYISERNFIKEEINELRNNINNIINNNDINNYSINNVEKVMKMIFRCYYTFVAHRLIQFIRHK